MEGLPAIALVQLGMCVRIWWQVGNQVLYACGVGKAASCLLHRAFPKASAEASERGRVALRWTGMFFFLLRFLRTGFPLLISVEPI